MRTFLRSASQAFFGIGMMMCPVAHAATESVLYSFKGSANGATDAANPVGGLAVVGDTIYGASTDGGGPAYDGTIFAVTTSGVETVLHDFTKGGGGQHPLAGVIAVGGVLYGTDTGPCCHHPYGDGQVIKVTLSGRVFVVHRFKGGPSDGADPSAPLLHKNGTFYGTTLYGGNVDGDCGNGPYTGCGTVFSVTPAGTESVLYAFEGGVDGRYTGSPLVWDNGRLYGTTSLGGIYGNGVVFSVTTTGVENVLYSFKNDRDGGGPSGLLDVGGLFYGTAGGGAGGNGTVFSMTKSGRIKILHEFRRKSDGAGPNGGLINVGGTLYGTTTAGGGGPCSYPQTGCGTVFSIAPDGTETVVHAFQGAPADGESPEGPLVSIGGDLYGVTFIGGTDNNGTVFVVTP